MGIELSLVSNLAFTGSLRQINVESFPSQTRECFERAALGKINRDLLVYCPCFSR